MNDTKTQTAFDGITFDDVLIQPRFSTISSRKDVDLSTVLSPHLKLSLPVISANMASITEKAMAEALSAHGGLGILHRFSEIDENVALFKEISVPVGVSIGITEGERARANALIEAGAQIICIDVAHGAQQGVVDQVTWLRRNHENLLIIAGNFGNGASIAEFNAAFERTEDQPDLYKVGIGPGSACTTRIKTGAGVPQLTAIADCHHVVPGKIIADGGLRYPGDIAKALMQGAVAVMVGGMLAGTDEAASHTHYAGSASGHYGSGWKTSEGEAFDVTEKGPVSPILKDIEGGLRSALTYVGARNLKQFREKGQFIRISPATVMENRAHGKTA